MRVLVTGATKGIGKAIVEKFAAHGASLAICARTAHDVDQFVSVLQNQYPSQSFLGYPVDVSQKQEVIDFGQTVLKEWESIDVLINNAGLYLGGETLKEEDGALEQMIETNLYSAYHLTRIIAPAMVQQKNGHIFNMCSIASLFAYPNGGSYSISKFAMHGFSKVLREELKPHGVRVTSVLPGATWSASWEGVDLPQERLMPAADIASVVFNAYSLSSASVVEELIIRPQLGDL